MRSKQVDRADAVPKLTLERFTPDALCVTKGQLGQASEPAAGSPRSDDPERRPGERAKNDLPGARSSARQAHVEVPTFRAVASGHAGDAAAIRFVVRGTSSTERALDSGELRRQLGLKLRAENGCNLVYVMWRLDPKPKLEVSIKRNPGARTAADCGADGYTKVKPLFSTPLPALEDGNEHELRAEIVGDTLIAWIDRQIAWQGWLPAQANELQGPAGVRSDNLSFDLTGMDVDSRTTAADPQCRHAAD